MNHELPLPDALNEAELSFATNDLNLPDITDTSALDAFSTNGHSLSLGSDDSLSDMFTARTDGLSTPSSYPGSELNYPLDLAKLLESNGFGMGNQVLSMPKLGQSPLPSGSLYSPPTSNPSPSSCSSVGSSVSTAHQKQYGPLVCCLESLENLERHCTATCLPLDEVLTTNRAAVKALHTFVGERSGHGTVTRTDLILCSLIMQSVADMYHDLHRQLTEQPDELSGDPLPPPGQSDGITLGLGSFEIDGNYRSMFIKTILKTEIDVALGVLDLAQGLFKEQRLAERCRSKSISDYVLADSRSVLKEIKCTMDAI